MLGDRPPSLPPTGSAAHGSAEQTASRTGRELGAGRLRPRGGSNTDFWPHSFHATPIGSTLKYHIHGGGGGQCPGAVTPHPFRRLYGAVKQSPDVVGRLPPIDIMVEYSLGPHGTSPSPTAADRLTRRVNFEACVLPLNIT